MREIISCKYNENDHISIEEDENDEIEITMVNCYESCCIWLYKEDAIKLAEKIMEMAKS